MKSLHRAPRDAQSTFVPALRQESRIVEVEVMRELPAAPITVPMATANYTDKARGFSIATAPLATITGIVVAIIGVVGWQVPLASLITLLLALGGFAAVWLAAYLGHVFVSSDGALLISVILTWRYLGKEQRERHARYRKAARRE